MTRITRKFEWDSGHRVLGHQGKCRHLHGHRYVAEVTVDAPQLNELGMVVDFSVLKKSVGEFIDAYWDHQLLLHPDDPLIPMLAERGEAFCVCIGYDNRPYNPTAENLAEALFRIAQELLNEHSLRVVEVTIYETPNCWATFRGA